MAKYKDCRYFTRIDPNAVGDWYMADDSEDFPDDLDEEELGNDYFHVIEKGLMVNYDCIMVDGNEREIIYFIFQGSRWTAINPRDGMTDKELFRTELQLRRTSIWRAINDL